MSTKPWTWRLVNFFFSTLTRHTYDQYCLIAIFTKLSTMLCQMITGAMRLEARSIRPTRLHFSDAKLAGEECQWVFYRYLLSCQALHA